MSKYEKINHIRGKRGIRETIVRIKLKENEGVRAWFYWWGNQGKS